MSRALFGLVLLLVAGLFAPVDAFAACDPNTLTCATRAEAYAAAQGNVVPFSSPTYCSLAPGEVMVNGNNYPNPPYTGYTKWRRCPQDAARTMWYPWSRVLTPENPSWGWAQECPAGNTWIEAEHRCHNPQECLDKAPIDFGFSKGNGADSGACRDGCAFKGDTSRCTGTGDARVCQWSGLKPTGNACAAEPPAIDQSKQECLEPTGAPNQPKLCVKPNGDHCYSTAGGSREICWRPGEVGDRYDDNTQQRRNPGETPIPPNLQLPSGDTLTQSGNPNTSTTNVTNHTSNVTNNITTTTTNYTTNGGTNPGPPGDGDGEPGDGSGEGGEGEEGEGEEGQVSGGSGCSAPPVCTHGSSEGCYHAQEAWRLRCEAANDGSQSGMSDIQNALADYHEEEAADLGAELGTDGEGDLNNHRVVNEIDATDFDDAGFLGGGSCPSLPTPSVAGTPLPIDLTKLCDLLGNVGQIVLALAYFIAFKIVATGGR